MGSHHKGGSSNSASDFSDLSLQCEVLKMELQATKKKRDKAIMKRDAYKEVLEEFVNMKLKDCQA